MGLAIPATIAAARTAAEHGDLVARCRAAYVVAVGIVAVALVTTVFQHSGSQRLTGTHVPPGCPPADPTAGPAPRLVVLQVTAFGSVSYRFDARASSVPRGQLSHPGPAITDQISTNLGGPFAARTAACVGPLLDHLLLPLIERRSGLLTSPSLSRTERGRRLWEESERLTGVSFAP